MVKAHIDYKNNPFFYVGVGGDSPAVYIVKELREAERVLSIDQGHSVYSLSISPGKKRFSLGTRNRNANDRFGKVGIYSINPDGQIEGRPVLSCYQRTSVSALMMMNEDIAVSGGLDGNISVWDVKSPNVAQAQLEAHNGPVLSLQSLSESLVASIGLDGIVKIWDITTCQVTREFPVSRKKPVVSNLLQLHVLTDEKVLLAHHPCGTVYMHPLSSGGESKPFSNNNFKASAFTVAGENAVYSDLHSLTLNTLSLSDNSKSVSNNIKSAVLGLYPVDFDKVLVVYRQGEAEVINARSLEKIHSLKISNVRSASSLPRREQLTLGEVRRTTDRERMIAEARESMKNDRWEDIQSKIEKLNEAGLGLDASILLAEWCHMHNKILWELKVLIALCEELPVVPESAIHFYNLGNILEQLNEPQRALQVYQIVTECDPQFKDTQKRIEKLEPFKDIKPVRKGVIVDYLGAKEKILQEIEKYAAFGEIWTSPVTMLLKDTSLGKFSFSLKYEKIKEHLDNTHWDIVEHKIQKHPFKEPVSVKWLKYFDKISPIPGLSYIIESTEIAGSTHLIHKYLILPPEGDSPDEVGVEFARRLEQIEQNEFKSWSNALEQQIKKAVTKTIQIEGSGPKF